MAQSSLNLDAFHAAQRRTEQAGATGDMANAQIPPWEWEAMGGNMNEYEQLYGPQAFWDASGNPTSLGQQHNIQPADSSRPKGPFVEPGTAVHRGQYGEAIAPAVNTGSDAGLIQGAYDTTRFNASQQQQFNRPNESGPFGSSQWVTDPVTGQLTRETELDPWQQRIYEQGRARDYELGNTSSGRLQQFTDQGQFNYGSLPKLPGQDGLLEERRRQENELYKGYMSRLDPEFQRDREGLNQRMADLGLDTTGEKADELMAQQGYKETDARTQAQTRASELAGGEYTRNYNIGKDIRDTYKGEYQDTRYAPLNEMSSLQGLQGDMIKPDFSPISQIDVQKVDPASIGLTYRGQDIQKQIAELQAQTQLEAARIGAEAGGEEDSGIDYGGGIDVNLQSQDDGSGKSLFTNGNRLQNVDNSSGGGGMIDTSKFQYGGLAKTAQPKQTAKPNASGGWGGLPGGF
jgi:hypothetical protein